MKASDYIVEYLIVNSVTDVFGYPGGMVIHLMDSLSRYSDRIAAHSMYHEQGAAFAAHAVMRRLQEEQEWHMPPVVLVQQILSLVFAMHILILFLLFLSQEM